MSLYYEAARVLSEAERAHRSLKAHVYNSRDLQAPAAQVYALITQARLWSGVLSEVIDAAGLLIVERPRLTPVLAVLLVHDLLLAPHGIAAAAQHPLRRAVERHRTRLQAEFTRARVRRKLSSAEAFRAYIDQPQIGQTHVGQTQVDQVDSDTESIESKPRKGSAADGAHAADRQNLDRSDGKGLTNSFNHVRPRWIRINNLRSTLAKQLETTFGDYHQTDNLQVILAASDDPAHPKVIYADEHIPDLVAVPASVDVLGMNAYQSGDIILQDKASCFPAYLLTSISHEGDIVDACAAPGNKTTHLAALISSQQPSLSPQSHQLSAPLPPAPLLPRPKTSRHIWACDRDVQRASELQKMVQRTGASKFVTVRQGQDFLQLNPTDLPWKTVGALLLDPSCSGSGIVSRTVERPFQTPTAVSTTLPGKSQTSRRKRKRHGQNAEKGDSTVQKIQKQEQGQGQVISETEPTEMESVDESSNAPAYAETRLKTLAEFQLRLLLHAMRFPAAQAITYSTCSIHQIENEDVVVAALDSSIARDRGWRLLTRDEQPLDLRAWPRRGLSSSVASTVADACLRCAADVGEGTQGFFVAGFVRSEIEVSQSSRAQRLRTAGVSMEHALKYNSDKDLDRDEDEDSEWNGFDN